MSRLLALLFLVGCTPVGLRAYDTDDTDTSDDTDDTHDTDLSLAEPPVADAGRDLSVSTGRAAFLDGSGSSDPGGLEPLTFEWTVVQVPASSSTTLDAFDIAQPTFTPDQDGEYVFALTVANSEGIWDPTPDEVVVTATTEVIAEPVADAGDDQVVSELELVTLDGTDSYDPGGNTPLVYEWSLAARPVGSAYTVTSPSLDTWSFVPDMLGIYVFELTVQNSAGIWDATPDSVQITVEEPASALPPVADAGADRTVAEGDLVILDGSGSTDPQGLTPLDYDWTLLTWPPGSTAVLSNASTVSPSFTADLAGPYVVELTVQNSAGIWDPTPDPITVTAQGSGLEPVADAGPDQTVDEGSGVTLDGSGSSDPGGNTPLVYSWTLSTRPGGSAATLSGATSVAPTFVADLAGTYLVDLAVQNSAGVWDSTPDQVQVTAQVVGTSEPVANAGADQVVATGQGVGLDGTASSDPQGLTPLSYQWSWVSLPGGSGAALSDATVSQPTFVADVDGTYVLELTVANSAGVWDPTPDQVLVTALTAGEPVADAGPDLLAQTGNWITVDGSGSYDPSGLDPITYEWAFTNWPTGSQVVLSSTSDAAPTFYADLPGVYALQLTVRNAANVQDSTPDTVFVNVFDPYIPDPVGIAGPDQVVEVGEAVFLDGTDSYDPLGNPLSYVWTLVEKPQGSGASLVSSSSVDPAFVADVAGTYRVQLSVGNSLGVWDPSPDEIVVVAEPEDINAPVAYAGADATVPPLVLYTLDGSGSYDLQSQDPLVYEWTMLSAPANSSAVLSDPSSSQPQFAADVAGRYVFELAVRSSAGLWDPAPDQVVISAVPTEGFYAEVTWDAAADLDLHVLNETGELFGPGDVNYCTPSPEWGVAGTADNPTLLWGSDDGLEPEVVATESPTGSYDVVVHYYGEDGYNTCTGSCSSTQAQVRLYLAGDLVRTYSRSMFDQGQAWHVATIDWPAGDVTTVDAMSSTTLDDCW